MFQIVGSATFVINRPTEEVFALGVDIENMYNWISGVSEVQDTSEGNSASFNVGFALLTASALGSARYNQFLQDTFFIEI